jgi:gamma-glutamyltranspeptidase / glutathione hydrolase
MDKATSPPMRFTKLPLEEGSRGLRAGLDWQRACGALLSALCCFGGCQPHKARVPQPAPKASAASQPSAKPRTSGAKSKESVAPEAATGFRKVAPVHAKRQMAVAAHPAAARAGADILRAGGSAVDAAIAMSVMLTLVEPQSSGIGGGAFMLHYNSKTKGVQAYDGRETAPAAATGDMFLKDGKPLKFFDAVVGGLSVGVPGILRMLEMAHKKHGKLPWKRLFQPAIRLAKKGFAMSPRLASLVAKDPYLCKQASAAAYFCNAAGKAKPAGSTLHNPALADVLDRVAKGGAAAFYQGPVAADIVSAVKKAQRPGRMRLKDLKNYQAVERKALCRRYRKEHLVCGMPPPTSGGVTLLQILGILENFQLANKAPNSVEFLHLFAEAGKLAYADRGRYLADPDFYPVPTDALLEHSYLATRAKQIKRNAAMGKAAPGTPTGQVPQAFADDQSLELPSTSHMVAVDDAGNAVSMTASIENAFGSRLMVRGFLLNNELTDFSFAPMKNGARIANRIEANKRPRSSMAPLVVLNHSKELRLLLGSPGGSRIIAYVARALVAILDQEQDIQRAFQLPNIANRNGYTEIENLVANPLLAQDLLKGLKALGHKGARLNDMNSGLHGILVKDKQLIGAVDPRREGLAVGD